MTDARAAQRGREYEAHSLELGGGFPRYHRWLMSRLSPFIRGRVIELGAGVGTIAAYYVDRVSETLLVEPATNLHDRLACRFAGHRKVKTACGFLGDVVEREGLAPASFDVAIMVNVLEHIEDDREAVRELFSLLKPGGHLLVFVPALPALYGTLDEDVGHFRRYTRRSLGAVVANEGFRIERMQYFDLLGVIPWLVTGRLLRRVTVGDGSARLYDRFVVPVCELTDRLAGPGLGKNLVCVAARP